MPGRRPNILLITSDQQHWNTLGCLNPEVRTPNLDRLARQGVMFTRAYTVNPTCTPTRASMITGRYPSQHGAYSLGTKLLESEPTIGDVLDGAGYRTALVGKAHFQPLHGTEEFPSLEAYPVLQDLGFWRTFHGPFYGFRHVELARNHTDEAHVGQHYALWMEEKGCANWRDYFRPPTGNNDRQKRTWRIPEEFHYDTWIADRTNALLRQYREEEAPFFLWASFFDPHPAYLVPEPWDRLYDPSKLTVPAVVPGEHDRNPPHFRLTQDPRPDFSPWRVTGQGLHGFHSHLHDREELARNIAIYYAMITLMDKHIGAILDTVDGLGLARDTLVVFTTDHGHLYGQHGLIAKGAFHYEDLIKVPFIVRQPGRVPVGAQSDALQSLVDLPVTFLRWVGVGVPRWMTGLDQTEVWEGKREAVREHVLVENRHEPDTIHVKTYVDERYKLTVYFGEDYGELFDLQEDPGEVHNRWDDPARATLKAELMRKLVFAEMAKEPLLVPRTAGA
jgi:arylsulfatase A-like enzyme